MVIDGQQRLTTVCLILEALAQKLGETEPVEGFSAKKIRNYYLLNPLEDGESHFKLLLTQTDKESLLARVEQRPWPKEYSSRIKENFELFEKEISKLNGDLRALCIGLAKLVVVDISLSRDQDNPQLIFESMNSTGRELSQADLIRNFILMGLEQKHQTRLYQEHWRPMEVSFGQEAYGTQFDSFIRHYLTLKTGEIPNVRRVYEAFKAYARSPESEKSGVDALVADIHKFADYFCSMALGAETDKKLAAAFSDLRELKVDVAYPFLLGLYQDYRDEIISSEEFEEIVRMIESYVFRRAICSIPTNSLNKTFATFRKEINESKYVESIKAHFLLLPSYRRFPNDDEFRREIKTRDVYNFRSRSYWLRRIENYDRKERVLVDQYTIEHILPQNERLSDKWKATLGPNWKTVHDTYLHTLGNLTLTGYNSEYSDKPFDEKRDMKGGFKQSPLKLNQGLGMLDAWDEPAIMNRAERLSVEASLVWGFPSISSDILDQYRPQKAVVDSYSINDHPYLVNGSEMYGDLVPRLFELIRKELVALDPCVTEEFFKLYVAYKAETNFVDIVPQAKRLLLSLNMKFHELSDEKGIARDLTGKSRWGNGDVEIPFTSPEELPYLMGLIRQSFEKQMGNGVELE